MKDLSIVIPCYNEQDNIIPLFEKLQSLIKLDNNLEIIIVDNGSTDGSLKIIKKHLLYKNNSIILIIINKNIGYGHGIMSGVYKSNTKCIAWCHADLQLDPFEVYYAYKKYKYELCNNKIIIKGRRKGRNIIDIFFTNGMSIVTSVLFKFNLSDINAQPKIFSREFIKYLDDYPKDFSLDLYLLIIAKNNKYKIVDYPIVIRKRLAGIAKGGGTLGGKLILIVRTFKYLFAIKQRLK